MVNCLGLLTWTLAAETALGAEVRVLREEQLELSQADVARKQKNLQLVAQYLAASGGRELYEL